MNPPLRAFTDRDIQAARAFLDKVGGAEWAAVRKQTLIDDDQARRVGVRMIARLQAAGLARDRMEATRLMFEIIRRLRRDIAVAGQIKAMLRGPGTARRRLG